MKGGDGEVVLRLRGYSAGVTQDAHHLEGEEEEDV